MLASIIFTIGAILQTVGGGGLGLFYGGRIIAGLGIGAVTMIVPTFVSEMAPKLVRGRLLGLWQFFIVTGVTISYWIDYGPGCRAGWE